MLPSNSSCAIVGWSTRSTRALCCICLRFVRCPYDITKLKGTTRTVSKELGASASEPLRSCKPVSIIQPTLKHSSWKSQFKKDYDIMTSGELPRSPHKQQETTLAFEVVRLEVLFTRNTYGRLYKSSSRNQTVKQTRISSVQFWFSISMHTCNHFVLDSLSPFACSLTAGLWLSFAGRVFSFHQGHGRVALHWHKTKPSKPLMPSCVNDQYAQSLSTRATAARA